MINILVEKRKKCAESMGWEFIPESRHQYQTGEKLDGFHVRRPNEVTTMWCRATKAGFDKVGVPNVPEYKGQPMDVVHSFDPKIEKLVCDRFNTEAQKFTFNEYVVGSAATALDPSNKMPPPVFWMLGLQGELGELFEKVKKVYRDKDGEMTEEFKDDVAKELGDILWYWVRVCESIRRSPAIIAIDNLNKLYERKRQGTIQGSGDNR